MVGVVGSYEYDENDVPRVARVAEGGHPVSHTGAGVIPRIRLRAALTAGKGNAARTMKAIEDCIGTDAKADPYVLLNFTKLSKANAPDVAARIQTVLRETVRKYAQLQVRGLALRCDVSGLARRRNRFGPGRSARQAPFCESLDRSCTATAPITTPSRRRMLRRSSLRLC